MIPGEQDRNCLLVIFGATGDLTSRKLVPALYQLEEKGQLPEAFAVVAVARRTYSIDQYLENTRQKAQEHIRSTIDGKVWKKLARRFHYQSLEFDQPADYKALKQQLDNLAETMDVKGNRLFYMAVSPQFFGPIANQMEAYELLDRTRGWQRLMIEKPFGRDTASARELNQALRQVFEEEELFRIDHYLVKEMVQNLMTLRAANQIFEPAWNADHIDHVQIISTEAEGVGTRGGYYDRAGVLRDMVQNHMLQMLAISAMELPSLLTAEKLRVEKVRVLKSLVPLAEDQIHRRLVLGQYQGYREEAGVALDSTTETFAALRVYLHHSRWQGVPFYLKTGKGLAEKAARIVIQYKLPIGSWSLEKTSQSLMPNRLTINIQPQEGVVLAFNTKEPGTLDTLLPVNMDFCQNCLVGSNTPEAYEKLLMDAIKGDQTSFTHWDEVEASWQWTDAVITWAAAHPEAVHDYPQGSQGPKAARSLMNREEGREWL
jgi:glucose-6-phosphate 1-dehydrogenase